MEKTTIYFGQLPITFSIHLIKTIVEPFGRAYNVRIIPQKDPNIPMYGFAEMTPTEADLLLDFYSRNTLLYWGQEIIIQKAVSSKSHRSEMIDIKKKKRTEAIRKRIKERAASEA